VLPVHEVLLLWLLSGGDELWRIILDSSSTVRGDNKADQKLALVTVENSFLGLLVGMVGRICSLLKLARCCYL